MLRKPPKIAGKTWPKFLEKTPTYVELNGAYPGLTTGTGLHKENCDLLKEGFRIFNNYDNWKKGSRLDNAI